MRQKIEWHSASFLKDVHETLILNCRAILCANRLRVRFTAWLEDCGEKFALLNFEAEKGRGIAEVFQRFDWAYFSDLTGSSHSINCAQLTSYESRGKYSYLLILRF